MAGEVGTHDMRARRCLLALLDQVSEGLFHEHPELAAFLLSKVAHGGKDLGINLGGTCYEDQLNLLRYSFEILSK